MPARRQRIVVGKHSQKVALLTEASVSKPPAATIAAYIDAAPAIGKAHLDKVYGIIKKFAPDAVEVLDYGTPYFTEPRFLFAFSALEHALRLAPTDDGLEPFRDKLRSYEIKNGGVLFPYAKSLPVELIRTIAAHRVENLKQNKGGRIFR